MNLAFYLLGSVLIAGIIGYLVPRTAIVLGGVLLLLGLIPVGLCMYHEVIISTPHDTSQYGMLATISALTLIPFAIGMAIVGFMRLR